MHPRPLQVIRPYMTDELERRQRVSKCAHLTKPDTTFLLAGVPEQKSEEVCCMARLKQERYG